MANRYADSGQDWWSQNDPSLNTGPMQSQTAAQSPPDQFTPGTQPAGFVPGQANPQALNQPGQTTWQQPGGWTGQASVGGPEQFGGDYQKWFMALVGNRPWNQSTLNALMPTLQQYGIKLTPPNAAGDQTKIGLPDGSWVRVGFGEGHPVWIPQGQGGASGGAGSLNPQGGVNSPWAIPAPFQSPTLQEFQQNDPGYQARMQMGQQALERSAAAQGSLLSGGTEKALNRY